MLKYFRKKKNLLLVFPERMRLVKVYVNFISIIPLEYKVRLVHTLLNCCFKLSSEILKFHLEVYKLKKILSKNAYSQNLINKCLQKSLNSMFM